MTKLRQAIDLLREIAQGQSNEVRGPIEQAIGFIESDLKTIDELSAQVVSLQNALEAEGATPNPAIPDVAIPTPGPGPTPKKHK